ncbi:MAG: proprotein convertase P-domain-containing protein [Phycisphaerae bacterium]|nr:proprotein convertase P-domain-containing protein [Phycisphaerae bacterium]
MTRTRRLRTLATIAIVAAVCIGLPASVSAIPPSPANDDPANAQDLGATLPVVIYGTTVLAANDINDSGGALPTINSYMDGPDVFYKITPANTATYRFQLAPWHHAPLRSSDRQFVIYVFEDLGGGSYTFVDGVRAPGSARPVNLDVTLTSGTEYKIGIDHDSATHDNFPFTLIVDELVLTNPDDCMSAITLPSALPVLVLNDIDGAANDFAFEQDGGRCAVSGSTPTTGPGIDHVYVFTPAADGDYAIELIYSGFPGVIYVDDSCPPFFLDGCLGASNHSTSGTSGGKHELVVVSLLAGNPYYIYVDDDSTSYNSGPYALIIDDAFNYEINEIEPNDTALQATPITTPLNGGQLVGPEDEDWYAVTGLTGDRVYTWVNNGGSSNSTLDTDVGFYATDGATLIEFDDEDGDGANAPIEDLYYIYSTTSPVIAGARMTADGTHYFRVTDQSATGTVHRYRFHTGLEPATRAPLAECEPNDTLAAADSTGKQYYAGVVSTENDVDSFAFDATVGDRVFVALDGDPERDGTGSTAPSSDPNVIAAKLVISDPAGDILISDISDSNSIQSAPDYPAQGGFFIARTTGRHYVQVSRGDISQYGPDRTYELAIFIDEQAGGITTEDLDPVVTLTPDYPNDKIAGEATDADSGICDVSLFADTNLQITNLSGMPGSPVTFDIELINPAESGWGKLLVTDCAGNTTCMIASIDVDAPVCDGVNFSNRSPVSLHDPIHVPDNQPSGPGIDGTIDIAESGIITDVNVTITVETIYVTDIDAWLESPTGTRVELITDRGSSLAWDITDATFDDDADSIMSTSSGDAPYTGTWLPEDPAGLAQLNGEDALGTWKLNVVDDSSSGSGGSRLVRWSLDVDAGFAGPETFAGTASDGEGIESIVLSGATNVQLNLPPDFAPGDLAVEYTVTLLDTSANGSGTVTVTDLQQNTCQSIVALNGLADGTGPANSGAVTTDLTFGAEVQADVPTDDPAGVVSSVIIPDSMLVGEVEASVTIDTDNVGRITSTLSHGGAFASLLNRTGMDERYSVGLTKDNIEITLDDDAPAADDAHLEPALGSIEFLGLHQPDGRGEYLLNGINTDNRDNMLFALAGVDSAGQWDLYVADVRLGFASSNETIFRRWSATIKNPCGPDRYVGTAMDLYPGTGICSIALAGGATNLAVDASFTPGDEIVDYVVTLVDPSQPGSGTLEITDCATNVTTVPINLTAAGDDESPPVATGAVNPATHEFEGSATDNGAGDTGIDSVELLPYADNLGIVSVTPDPPGGAGSVSFVVGLVDPMANGRGYVRVTDGCGLRGHALVEIDGLGPVCTGWVGNTKRYLSTDLPQDLPDNNTAGVSSSIVVPDIDTVEDVNITFNILHPNAMDIDMTMTSPTFIDLFSDRGSTGNDFIDVTLDDEAAEVIPSSYSAAPFTGSWQPESGSLSALDGVPAVGTYTLKVVDDATNYTGSFESWSLTIESSTFPERFDGRAEDGEAHDAGICTIELLPGATNVTLIVDPFDPGAAIVRYSVDLDNTAVDGAGTVRVTDCVGNTCEMPVSLRAPCDWADLNQNGDIGYADYQIFLAAFGHSAGDPEYDMYPAADHNGDGIVTGIDYQMWLLCYREFVGDPGAPPPSADLGGKKPGNASGGTLPVEAGPPMQVRP